MNRHTATVSRLGPSQYLRFIGETIQGELTAPILGLTALIFICYVSLQQWPVFCVLEVDILAKQGLVHPLRHKTHDASWPQLLLMVRRSGRSTSTWSCGLLWRSVFIPGKLWDLLRDIAGPSSSGWLDRFSIKSAKFTANFSIPITHGLVERRWASQIPLKLRHSFFPFPVGSWPLLGITALLLIPYRNTLENVFLTAWMNESCLCLVIMYLFVLTLCL